MQLILCDTGFGMVQDVGDSRGMIKAERPLPENGSIKYDQISAKGWCRDSQINEISIPGGVIKQIRK